MVLYYQKEYLESLSGKVIRSFSDPNYGIHFSIEAGEAVSMSGSPFGSYFISGQHTPESFHVFESGVIRRLKGEGVRLIKIILPPEYYGQTVPKDLLIANGYQVQHKELSHFLDLTTEIRLHKMEERKLTKAWKEGLRFRVAGLRELPEIHQFISACRKRQGLAININLVTMERQFQSFPKGYKAFVVEQENELISATIMTRVSPSVCYYFLPATHPDFKSLSPMVFMIDELVKFYRSAGVSIMDLGISSIQGTPQAGLAAFKERMGARQTERWTMVKAL